MNKIEIKKFTHVATHVYVDLVKIGVGIKIATESKLRGLKIVVFLEDKNYNFRKLRGQKCN